MNTVENALLKQMQKLAASMGGVPSAGSGQNGQAAVSFQEMLQQSGNRVAETDKDVKKLKDKLEKDDGGPDAELQPVVRTKSQDEEELKVENLAGNPNAVNVLDLFRPEIVENTEQAEVVLNPIPQETVEGAAMDLGEQAPEMEAGVDAGIGAEVSMEQQPREFQQAMEEVPQQTVESAPVQQTAVQRQEEVPQDAVRETKETAEEVPEVRVERLTETEEPSGEAGVAEQPVFHETQAVPVKVGERYEVVDTRQPEMDTQVADAIRSAVQAGQEHIEIRLTPQNLGSLVIEMTRDTNGVLQVVLHAATPRTESLLNQHLNGLHSALQGYGHEEVRLEVQRNEHSEQQNFRQADPDGRGQHQHRQQQERQEEQSGGEAFMQKLRLGLFGLEE